MIQRKPPRPNTIRKRARHSSGRMTPTDRLQPQPFPLRIPLFLRLPRDRHVRVRSLVNEQTRIHGQLAHARWIGGVAENNDLAPGDGERWGIEDVPVWEGDGFSEFDERTEEGSGVGETLRDEGLAISFDRIDVRCLG